MQGKSSNTDRRCCPEMAAPSRERVYGVKMASGVMAKIVDEEKFSNWAWWLCITPRLASTVFIQPGLHLSVFLIIAISNIIYFLVLRASTAYVEETGQEVEQISIITSESINSAVALMRRLLTWLLAAYLARLVTTYYREARSKAGEMMKGLSALVGTLSISIDYDSPRARCLLAELHGAISSIAHYALSYASSNTKFRFSSEELQQIFDQRGLNGKYLLSFQKKETLHCDLLGDPSNITMRDQSWRMFR